MLQKGDGPETLLLAIRKLLAAAVKKPVRAEPLADMAKVLQLIL